jgi:hypothetical protein
MLLGMSSAGQDSRALQEESWVWTRPRALVCLARTVLATRCAGMQVMAAYAITAPSTCENGQCKKQQLKSSFKCCADSNRKP